MLHILVLLAALAVSPLVTAAQDPGRAALDGFLDGLDTLRADFEQVVLDTENAETGVMYGEFFLDRPGRFRWNYLSPTEQVILADGRDVWLIEAELKQVTRHLQKWALKNTPAAFLTMDAEVDDDFDVVERGAHDGMQWLELLPRDADSDLSRVLLAFDDGRLRRMELSDRFGIVSRFRFFDIARNVPLDPALFRFEGQDDWDILHGN
jgi:outer membrane lipoprotein carrier protein